LLGASHAVRAGDDQRRTAAALLPTYQQECAACHVAFPPGMLPSDSWRRLLNNLPRHYGTDASLDTATMNELATWLSANAGGYQRVREAPPEDRITKSAWFLRKHDEVPAAAWQRAAVKSPANCAACHAQASQGDFNEHSVRIPR
jgi:mono/diheme cytochrome c family protein